MPPQPQSFERHARLSPLFHGFVLPALLINLFSMIARLYRAPSAGAQDPTRGGSQRSLSGCGPTLAPTSPSCR